MTRALVTLKYCSIIFCLHISESLSLLIWYDMTYGKCPVGNSLSKSSRLTTSSILHSSTTAWTTRTFQPRIMWPCEMSIKLFSYKTNNSDCCAKTFSVRSQKSYLAIAWMNECIIFAHVLPVSVYVRALYLHYSELYQSMMTSREDGMGKWQNV